MKPDTVADKTKADWALENARLKDRVKGLEHELAEIEVELEQCQRSLRTAKRLASAAQQIMGALDNL